MSLKYKFYLLLFLVGWFLLICSHQDTPDNEKYLLQKKNPIGKYGENIELSVITTIQDLLNSPNEYVDKKVLIEGKIDEVCPMRGCWINILDPETDKNIRLKVKDGAIVFPLSAKGYRVQAQGIFQKLEFTEEIAKKWKIHLAEEKGIILHPDSVKLVPEDLIEYRIFGNRAIINE